MKERHQQLSVASKDDGENSGRNMVALIGEMLALVWAEISANISVMACI